MTLLARRYVLLAKREATYDTDPVPTAADDAVLVENLRLAWPSEIIEPPHGKPAIGAAKPIHGRRYGQLTFDVALKGSGTPGTPPDWGPILSSCGFLETTFASSVVYTTASSSLESCTIYVYRDGLRYRFFGCRGNVSFNFTAGQRPMMSFTMSGHPSDAEDVQMVDPTVDSTTAVALKSASFSMGGYASVISALTLDMQNAVEVLDSVNGNKGYGDVIIAGRNPLGSFDPEAVLVPTNDFFAQWAEGTQQALTIAAGATAGNIGTLTAPGCYSRELNEGDRNGALIYDIPFTAAEITGDDEVSLVMT